jgi:hypothetical protein
MFVTALLTVSCVPVEGTQKQQAEARAHNGRVLNSVASGFAQGVGERLT